MEMKAVDQERVSLENQLASLRTQINNLDSEVEEQRDRVSIDIYFGWFFSGSRFVSSHLQVVGCYCKEQSRSGSLRAEHDSPENEGM